MTFRAAYDDDLDRWVVLNEHGHIVVRKCADRHTAEDVAHALICAADLDSRLA